MSCPYCDEAVDAIKGFEGELSEIKAQRDLVVRRNNDLLREIRQLKKEYGASDG